jgi:glycosyltransferase involved in cell wall biosynthesis
VKKVLHITISSDIGGGPEHIYQLITGLSKQIESHVACPDNGPYYTKYKSLVSNRVTKIPFRRFELKYIFSLYKYIKNNQINLLHGHGKGAGIYCRILKVFLKIPTLHTPHGISVKQNLSNKLYILFERLFKFLVNAVIYVSQTEYEISKKLNLWIGVPAKVIYNGTATFNESQKSNWRCETRSKMNWGNRKVVITASRYDFQKNTIEFCKIAQVLPTLIFVILGDGVDKKECETYCVNNNINNVLFLGAKYNPSKYFAAADIYLSTARWEGLSMAIIEAMALGLPTVATNVTGNIDLVRPGINGYLYSIGDVAEAQNLINTLLEPQLYTTCSANAVKCHKESFSVSTMSVQTEELYFSLLEL